MPLIDPDFLSLQGALSGEYSLTRELGRGGMGVVYLARDVQLDRDVAIKVLPSHMSADDDLRARFLREARTAARLSHPNIVPIHRVGEAGGFVFFVMSYVPGQTLGERLRAGGPIAPADVTRIMREVAWALGYAHEHGIIHRDIKPDNILLEERSGRALVTDFGIARSSVSDTNTDPARIAGTAHFMSPEQAAGETLDGRSDLYALGVVGYLAVSGQLPFEAASVPALFVKQATQVPARIAKVAPGIPQELAATIDRCLARHPGDRISTGSALADALQPRADAQRQLPLALRHWLSVKNPAHPVFVGMAAISGISLLEILVLFKTSFPPGQAVWTLPALLLAAPVVPILGFHIAQARRLFKAGYSLDDVRCAIVRDEAEQREISGAADNAKLTIWQKYLRLAIYANAVQAFVALGMITAGVSRMRIAVQVEAVLGLLGCLALSNIFAVPLLPGAVRSARSFRDRLWMSPVGAWIARRLHAPVASNKVDAGVFRPTDVALGAAASELFNALPTRFREQLAELPLIVQRLERQAADARARLEELSALAGAGGMTANPGMISTDAEGQLRRALAESVGALENVRLDLLRLHADASDVAPLTTLLGAVHRIRDDVTRLAEARREVDRVVATPRRVGTGRIPTPA